MVRDPTDDRIQEPVRVGFGGRMRIAIGNIHAQTCTCQHRHQGHNGKEVQYGTGRAGHAETLDYVDLSYDQRTEANGRGRRCEEAWEEQMP